MPVDSIMAPMWAAAIARCSTSTDPTVKRLASMLSDVIDESMDPVVGMILDRHAREVLG